MCGPHPGRILRIHHPVLQPKVASSILIVFSDGRHVGEEKVHGFGIWNGKVLHRGSEGNGRLTTALQNTAGKGVRRKRITTITSTTSPRSALINFINQGRPSRPSRRRSGDLAKESGLKLAWHSSLSHTRLLMNSMQPATATHCSIPDQSRLSTRPFLTPTPFWSLCVHSSLCHSSTCSRQPDNSSSA